MEDPHLVRHVAVSLSHQNLGPFCRDETLMLELTLVVGVNGVGPLS
jgi:hypothetical protein